MQIYMYERSMLICDPIVKDYLTVNSPVKDNSQRMTKSINCNFSFKYPNLLISLTEECNIAIIRFILYYKFLKKIQN